MKQFLGFLLFLPLYLPAQDFSPYTERIPGAGVRFEMVPVPAGEFLMGSPEEEKGRKEDEGPQHLVKVDAFWMGAYEVSWGEFEKWVYAQNDSDSSFSGMLEAGVLTRPTPPYLGIPSDLNHPATGMTQYAAQMYCKYLTQKTGHFYRLPTEAEWEYACRAGANTAFPFGDKPKKLDQYAWFEQAKPQATGQLKPNAWGLYDMHGNVAEWTLDRYTPEGYSEGPVENPLNPPEALYPHSVRGGAFDDPAERCRCAARLGSKSQWKIDDPQLPKSLWWHTRADFVGFRVVRPLNPPPPEEIESFWPEAVEEY